MPLTIIWTNNSGVAITQQTFDVNLAGINRVIDAYVDLHPEVARADAPKAMGREWVQELRRMDRQYREKVAKEAAVVALGTDPTPAET
jgi:hypothetical protein